MDISSLESIAAITKVVNPKENIDTEGKGVTEKELATSTQPSKILTPVRPQSPMELKIETQEAINNLLKSINKLLGDGVEKLPPQLKEQLTNIIKQNTNVGNLHDGLANLLKTQKNINQDILKLSDTMIKNLFEHLENNPGTNLPKNNLASSLLKPESMFADSLPKETLLPEQVVEKALNEILAKLLDNGKEAKTTDETLVHDKNKAPAENSASKPAAPDTAPGKPSADAVLTNKNQPEQNLNAKPAENANPNANTKSPETASTNTNMKPPEQASTTSKNLPNNTTNQQQSTNMTKENILPDQNTTGKTVAPTKDNTPLAPKAETTVPSEKSADNLSQNTSNAPKAQTATNTETKTNINTLKSDAPVATKSEAPLTAANRLVETLRLAENQSLPKSNQEVQTLLLGLKDNLMKLTENNSQLNNLLQKFLQEGKDLNKSETALLNKFIEDNLPKLFSSSKTPQQQVLPKETLQILQKNFSSTNEQTQKDLELLNSASKNTNTSEAAKQIKTQVENWASTIKDLANTFVKSSQSSLDTSKSLQTSFAFMMNGEDGKLKPAHIHIYHEKKRRDNSIEKPAETWLKLSLDYEYAGEVNAVFHLKNESILDIKVSFSESEAIAPFKTFIPDIKNALADSKLSLTQIVAE